MNLTVQWQPPQYDGGAPVNYIITVSPGLSPVTTSGTSVPVTVPYNVGHTVSIVATNCNGSSSATMVTIPAIGMCCSEITVQQELFTWYKGSLYLKKCFCKRLKQVYSYIHTQICQLAGMACTSLAGISSMVILLLSSW